MYFDVLYENVFVGAVLIISAIVNGIDRLVIDPLVNLTATIAKAIARGIGRADDLAVDGTVRLISDSVYDAGGTVAATQTGRVRGYVLAGIGVLAIGLATVVVLWIV